jgi:DNA-binding GntR family transcriptional regulator
VPIPDSLTLDIDRSGRAWQQVYTALRAAIVTAELEPGLSVSEQELALRLNISRTPVREALIRLSEEGLVGIYPQMGTVIAPIRYVKVYQSLVIRSALECRSMRYTIPLLTSDDVARLRAIIAEQRRLVRAHDDQLFLHADDAFHRTMVEIAENHEIWKVIDSTKAHHDRIRHLSTQLRRHNRSRVEEHEMILHAVERRDTAEAQRLLEAHLDPDRLAELWPQLVSQHPSYFEAE